MNHHFLSAGVVGAFAFTFLTLLADTYGSATTTEKYLGISSTVVLSLFLLFILFLRSQAKTIPKLVPLITGLVILPITTVATLVLSYIVSNSSENFVFSAFSLQYQTIALTAVGSFILVLLTLPIKWTNNSSRLLLACIPFVIGGYFFLASTWPFNYFIELGKEDHPIEWTQFVVISLAGILSLSVANKLRKKSWLYTAMYILIALGLFFIAGDEISWGQRLFGVSVPEEFAAANVQGEITLHNQNEVSKYIWQSYLFVSSYGSFAWIIAMLINKITSKRRLLSILFVPPWFTVPYFLISLWYQVATSKTHNLGQWSEPVELFLYLGVALFIWQVGLSLQTKK